MWPTDARTTVLHDYGVCTHTCHAMARESLPGMLFCVVTYDLHATSTEWLWAACQFVSVALKRSFCEVPASTRGTTEQIHTSHCLLAVSIHRSKHTSKQQQNKTRMSDHQMFLVHASNLALQTPCLLALLILIMPHMTKLLLLHCCDISQCSWYRHQPVQLVPIMRCYS